jgi:3-phosphoshikimate 1-carboxyvinyltransferase
MGADISAKNINGKMFPPIKINPVEKILPVDFKIDVASAQVKSALVLAGLYADGNVSVREPFKSRDHTERMLPLFGVPVNVKGNTVTVSPRNSLKSPKNVFVPGDFSSAAFFIVLGLITKDSRVKIKNVNINPTRIGLLTVLKRMGADIKIINKQNSYEPYADIEVRSSVLKGTVVRPDEIPLMVDEVPVLCVAAAFARGKTEIRGIEELRVKETDRVNSMISNLTIAGVDISDKKPGLVVNGGGQYVRGDFKSFGDHRTAMSMIVFAMALDKPSKIDDVSCINKSFPGFIRIIKTL